jgi:16S rRNA (guanine527-N7)-methyltransferase
VIDDVLGALAEARALGFLGPGPLDAHLASAEGFLTALGPLPPGARVLDLGSGGGVPGLILANRLPTMSLVLLDNNRRRTSFLARVVAELGWGSRVEVVRAAAEVAAHDPHHRARFAAVTARSFGPPATTAEVASGFLETGGRLLVAEPPEIEPGRWLNDGVERAGLHFIGRAGTTPDIAILASTAGPPPALPRTRREIDRAPLWP